MNAKYYPEKHQPIYGRHLGIGDATVKDSTYRRGPFATARVGALAAAAGITVLLSASLALTSCASGVGEPAESSSAAVQTTSMTSAPVSDPTGRIAGADSSANVPAAEVAPTNAPASDTSNAATPPTASDSGTASAGNPPASNANESQPTEEQVAENPYHIVTEDFEFDIPEYWQGKVDWSVDTSSYGMSSVSIYPIVPSLGAMPDYKLAWLDAVPIDSPEANNMGDIETHVAYKLAGSDKVIVLHSTNWGMHYATFFFNNPTYGGSSQEAELIDALVDLSVGGGSYPDPREVARNATDMGSVMSAFDQADIGYMESALVPSLSLAEGGQSAAEETPADDAEAADGDYGESDAGSADEAVPVGDYSFVAPRGGYRGGINVVGDGTATMANASAMSPDVETTVYSLEPTGETSPSGTAMISMVPIDGPGTTTLSLYYDSAQDALIVDGTAFVRV